MQDSNAFTKESVYKAMSFYNQQNQSLQNKIDLLKTALNDCKKLIESNQASQRLVKAATYSEYQQVFSTKDKMLKLALKDRPAIVASEDKEYVYDIDSKEWVFNEDVQTA